MDIGVKEMLDVMANQRNQALDQAVSLTGELALARARIAELEEENAALKAKADGNAKGKPEKAPGPKT